MAINFGNYAQAYGGRDSRAMDRLGESLGTALSKIPTRKERLQEYTNKFFQDQFSTMSGKFDLEGNYSRMVENPNYRWGTLNYQYEPKTIKDSQGNEVPNPKYKGRFTKKRGADGQPLKHERFKSEGGWKFKSKDEALNEYLSGMRRKFGPLFAKKMGDPIAFSAAYDEYTKTTSNRLKQQILNLKAGSPKTWTNKKLYDMIKKDPSMMAFMRQQGMFADPELAGILGPHTYFGDPETSVFGEMPATFGEAWDKFGLKRTPDYWKSDLAKSVAVGVPTLWAGNKLRKWGWSKVSGGWKTPDGTVVTEDAAKAAAANAKNPNAASQIAKNYKVRSIDVKAGGGKKLGPLFKNQTKKVDVYVDANGDVIKHKNGQPVRVKPGVEPPKGAVQVKQSSWKDFRNAFKNVKGKDVLKVGGKGLAGIGAYMGATYAGGKVGEAIGGEKGKDVGSVGTGVAMDAYFTNKAIKSVTGQNVPALTKSALNQAKNSVPKMAGQFGKLFKEKGWKWIAKKAFTKAPWLAAKTGLKSLLTGVSSPTVVLSAVMAGWTAYDAYSLMNILLTEYEKEGKNTQPKSESPKAKQSGMWDRDYPGAGGQWDFRDKLK